MKPIGVVIRTGNQAIVECARWIKDWALKKSHALLLERDTAVALGVTETGVPLPELVRLADPIVSLGGDGTLLGVGREVGEHSPTLIGVNFGNLGFLTEIGPAEVIDVLDRALQGDMRLARRHMLLAKVISKKKEVFTCQAVNDAVILKGTTDRLLDLDIIVDGEDVVRIRGDGIIVATPTGSTAYSLAAGGSIVHPSVPAFLVTPICAHSLNSRPLVLSLESTIEVAVPKYDGKIFLSLDGQRSYELKSKDVVQLTRSPYSVTFVRSPKKSYFEILRSKLNWGIANRSDN